MNRFPPFGSHQYPYYRERSPAEAAASSIGSSDPQMDADRVGGGQRQRVTGASYHGQSAAALAELARTSLNADERNALRDAALSREYADRSLILKQLIKSTQGPSERAFLRDTALSMGEEERARTLKRLFKAADGDVAGTHAERRSLREHVFATAVGMSNPARTSHYLQVLAWHPLDHRERAAILSATMNLPLGDRRDTIERLAESIESAEDVHALHSAAKALPDGAGALTLLRLFEQTEPVVPGAEASDIDEVIVGLHPSTLAQLRHDTLTAACDMPQGSGGTMNTAYIINQLIESATDQDELSLLHEALNLYG